MPNLSLTTEQSEIVNAITARSRNAIVNAVAGSGKTRTALATAIQWLTSARATASPRNVLLVAYNKRLQQDMLVQRDNLVPANMRPFIDIRTIHGFAYHYFGGKGLTTDKHLTGWTRSRAQPTVPLPVFGLVIIDEAQDLTPVLFDFLHYVLSLLNRPHLLVLGDPFQLLYRFKGAHERYILNADDMFADVAADAPFEYFRLSVCFRITHEMAEWINTHLNPNHLFRAHASSHNWFEEHKASIEEWWGQGISADPARPPAPGSVTYYKRTSLSPSAAALDGVVDEIKTVFEQFDMKSSALLSPSIVPNVFSPVRQITNKLKHLGGVQQPWFLDTKSVNSTEADILRKNKRIASTIHKFKGRERDAIVLVGLDDFAELREQEDPRNVFNMFYVGATRARHHLLIIQWSDCAYATHLSRQSEPAPSQEPYERRPCDVKQVLSFCPYNEVLCEESDKCLQSRTIGTAPSISFVRDDYIVSGAHTPRRLSTVESVTEIIGLGVKIKLQLLLDDGVLELPPIDEDDPQRPIELSAFLMQLKKRARESMEEYSWGELLEMATALMTMRDRLYSRWRQVRDFSRWTVVKQRGKLDELVRNLVRLLNMAIDYNGKEGYLVGKEVGMSGKAVGGVAYDRMVEKLKRLRKKKSIVFYPFFTFDMKRNALFVRRCATEVEGVATIMLLSEKIGAKRNGDEVAFVEVEMAPQEQHDDFLTVGCYGAMNREKIVRDRSRSKDVKMAQLFVVYPSIGKLTSVMLHMNSFEFLHRVGFRKINRPFDVTVLTDEHKSDGPVPAAVKG